MSSSDIVLEDSVLASPLFLRTGLVRPHAILSSTVSLPEVVTLILYVQSGLGASACGYYFLSSINSYDEHALTPIKREYLLASRRDKTPKVFSSDYFRVLFHGPDLPK